VNDAYCRFWNQSREDLLSTKFIQLIPVSARQSVLERIQRLDGGIDAHEHQVTLPDGRIGWHHWINHAIFDERGRVVELQGVGRDITDRKRAEEALEHAEQRNSAMLRAIPDLMFVLSRDGTFVDFHARDPKLLFMPPTVFLGRKLPDILPARLADRFMDAIERVLQVDETIVMEYELPVAGTRHFEGRLVNAGDDRVLCMVRDVTEAKRVAELNRDLAGRLIASQEAERQRIARELHDDLSQKIALLNIEIDQVAACIETDGLRSRVEEISARAGEIASDMHNLSHELHPPKLQMLGLVVAVESLCRDVSQQAGVPIVFSPGVLPPAIDPSLSLCLYRITQEALHNVTRHSRARDAHVSLMHVDDSVALQISDSGVGFDPQRRFEGLGLLSMRERVAFLGGVLVIDASPGGGTRITVHVPLAVQATDADAVSQSA